MKPFNLEEAKAGKPIVNTFGSKIKFIAFEPELGQPLICAINRCLLQFNANGQYFEDRHSEHDLFMAPTKHEGWVNVYTCDSTSERYACYISQPYKTEAIANSYAQPHRIVCVRIEWEE